MHISCTQKVISVVVLFYACSIFGNRLLLLGFTPDYSISCLSICSIRNRWLFRFAPFGDFKFLNKYGISLYSRPLGTNIVTNSIITTVQMFLQAFGWAYVNNRHNTWEQFYVYWICPFIGAILAAFVFRTVFPPPAKQKKA